MTYKNLMDQYKQGTLSEEERQMVEKEIEKQEAIEEYRLEILDEELDNLIKRPDDGRPNEETTKLKKSVNDRLRRVVLTSVLMVVLLYVGVFYVGSGLIDGLYYNPTATTMSVEKDYPSPDFYFDMEAYISLNLPGYTNASFTFQEAKGFGNYEISYSMQNLFNDEDQRYFMTMSRGRLTWAFDGIFSLQNRFRVWEGFEKIQDNLGKDVSESDKNAMDNEILRKNEETIRYLKELNALSYVSMDVVYSQDLSMEEFYAMTREFPSLNYSWVGVRTTEPNTLWNDPQPNHLIGFNPDLSSGGNRRPDPEKYPLFNLLDMRNNDELKKKDYPDAIVESYRMHFKSRLEYLRDREEFVGIFDYNYYKTDFYNDALTYIEDQGIKTYGGLLFGTPDELLKFMDEVPYASIYINEVLPTKPNIYYD